MRVNEMHPLCCLPLENPAAGNQSPEPRTKLSRSCSAADADALQWTSSGSESCSGCRSFAGAVHKWTNYGKGWRRRWLLLRNDVLSYSKNLQPETLVAGEDVRFIGDARFKHRHRCCSPNNSNRRQKHQKGVGIVHLKVSSFRESRSDERRFYVYTATKTLHLRANSKQQRAAWIEALDSTKTVSNLTERLTNRLLKEGTSEVLVKECEQIMLSDFSQIQGQLKSLSQDRLNLLHTIDQLEGCKTEVETSETDFFDAEDHFPELKTQSEGEMQRRKKLPEAAEEEQGVSLWSLIKGNVGKDLTRVCLPVYFNEPISSLQKCFEDLEYSYLLDQAYHHGNSLERILNVAAFAVSGYASSAGRICKPFNPLVGETYEADYPEKGLRFLSEKVSHHPTLIAWHCQGRGWKFWGDSNITSKFWGSSIQLDPVGVLTLEFDDGETFQWSKVTTSIYNLIFGKIYCDHHGLMHIQSNGEYSCSLNFKQHSFLERKPRQVHGVVQDNTGKKHATIFGKWDESVYCIANVKPNLLWERTMPPTNLTRYNLTSFAITLNELTRGLLPPTDSRLRPDQRHLENGEYGKANAEKLRLETRQRMSRKLQENGWKPRWFQKDAENGTYRYLGGYWEQREECNWEGCPNIFA